MASQPSLEKALCRISRILQEAFLNFRENTFVDPIFRIEEISGEIRIYKATEDWKKRPFPYHLVSTPSTKEILLMTGMRTYATGFTHSLLTKLTKDLDITIEEVQVHFRKTRLSVSTVEHDGKMTCNGADPHQILLITSNKSKAQWVIDVTGPQYGIQKSCWKWSEYQKENFVKSVVKIRKNGHAKATIAHLARKPGYCHLAYNIPLEIANQLDVGANKWASKNMELAKLPFLGRDFQRHATALQTAMNDAVRKYISTHDFTARIEAAKDTIAFEKIIRQRMFEHNVLCVVQLPLMKEILAEDASITLVQEKHIDVFLKMAMKQYMEYYDSGKGYLAKELRGLEHLRRPDTC